MDGGGELCPLWVRSGHQVNVAEAFFVAREALVLVPKCARVHILFDGFVLYQLVAHQSVAAYWAAS